MLDENCIAGDRSAFNVPVAGWINGELTWMEAPTTEIEIEVPSDPMEVLFVRSNGMRSDSTTSTPAEAISGANTIDGKQYRFARIFDVDHLGVPSLTGAVNSSDRYGTISGLIPGSYRWAFRLVGGNMDLTDLNHVIFGLTDPDDITTAVNLGEVNVSATNVGGNSNPVGNITGSRLYYHIDFVLPPGTNSIAFAFEDQPDIQESITWDELVLLGPSQS